MKNYYFIFLFFIIGFYTHAQFVDFDFDNAIINGNLITQTQTINGDLYQIRFLHGSISAGSLYDIGGGDLSVLATGGTRPEQNWTVTLLKNGVQENFDFISLDYLNTVTNRSHTFIVQDLNNTQISDTASILGGDAGSLIPSSATSGLNLSGCIVRGIMFFATMDVALNNLRIRPVSVMSIESEEIQKVNYFQDSNRNIHLSHSQLEDAQISILNMNGQLIKNLSATSRDYQIDVSELSVGIYIAQIMMGNRIETIKFVK